MSDKFDGLVPWEVGIEIVHKDYVMRVIEYLETKKMD